MLDVRGGIIGMLLARPPAAAESRSQWAVTYGPCFLMRRLAGNPLVRYG
jgi:hypothetical protein